MTKEELKAKVDKQQSIINDANHEIYSCVNDYIESLPYKLGDKVSCNRCDVCWIASIVPVDEKYIPVKVINELKASFCRAVEITIVKN